MANYNNKFNKDDVFLRSMIVALLAELNKKMYFYNLLDDGTVKKIDVPCLYSITGGERFLRDEFYYDSLKLGKAIGDYERCPRCVVDLNGMSINQSEQLNKYNHIEIVREVNKKLRTLYLNVDLIPITLTFDCKVACKTNLELFKMTETIISKIYKNNVFFHVDLGMFNVPAVISVPADYTHERPQEFGLNEKKEFLMSFNIEMKSYIPAFEHGLLLNEIDEMLQKLPEDASGVVEFRPNEHGEMEMRAGGVIETFRLSEYFSKVEEPTLKSNTHRSPMFARNCEDLSKKDYTENLLDRKFFPDVEDPCNCDTKTV